MNFKWEPLHNLDVPQRTPNLKFKPKWYVSWGNPQDRCACSFWGHPLRGTGFPASELPEEPGIHGVVAAELEDLPELVTARGFPHLLSELFEFVGSGIHFLPTPR